ncbi:hypothetical protein C8R45DRAFT_252678 [Mycena sanguinolenta]|nr:hypothetical protein C8R45DRAFT_252678 [Mycena sanguinolenta]
MEADPFSAVARESDLQMDSHSDHSDMDTDEFEVIDKNSVYDTVVEDVVPAVSRLRINTTPVAHRNAAPVARRIVREDSDDTLVDEPETPPFRARAPPSPVSPSSSISAPQVSRPRRMVVSPGPVNVSPSPVSPTSSITAPQVSRQRRMVASPVPVNVSPTTPRNRTAARPPNVQHARVPESGQIRTPSLARVVSPAPAPKTRTPREHMHEFLIQPNHPPHARVCACGALLRC